MNKVDFPILHQTVHDRALVYLDNAATSQKPQRVIDAISYAYTHFNSNIHRGVHHLSQVATAHHEAARQTVANFIHARSADEIIFTSGTTDSINTLASIFAQSQLHPGDEIIVSELEHHSNIVPWQMACERTGAVLRHIPLRNDLSVDLEAFKGLLNGKTKLVSIAQVSNVLGIVNDIASIIAWAHAAGVPVCIDGAQSAPHMGIDVQALDCDFMVFSGHKMYGPTGIGVLYGKREWLDRLPPYQGGGEMIDHVRWSGTTYNVLPYRFEAGTPNFIGSYALEAAIQYMQSIGMERIEAHETDLTAYCEQQLATLPGMRIYAAGQPKKGVISFNLYHGDQVIHPFDVGTLLDQQGIAVRTGHHCAEPLIDALGVPGTVRVSFGLYNDRNDVDALLAALRVTQTMLM